jgi:hypothetical protein
MAIMAAVQLLGGHWVVLQTTAWVTMVVSYSHDDSLVGALAKTFDGDHPCGLCKVVKKGQSEEQQQQVAKSLVKLDAVLTTPLEVPVQEVSGCRYAVVESVGAERTFAPLTPPPLRS